VIADAPGKIIISGEHFVVHGSVALVAAIGRGTRVEASPSDRLSIETSLQSNKSPTPRALPVEKVVREMYRERKLEPRVHLKITSDIPSGAGLGSSASAMVATVAAVSRMEGWNLDAYSIAETSMLGEKLVHGRPSGVDVASSVYGGLLEFRMGAEPWQVPLDKAVKFIIVYSGKRRKTGKLINKVSLVKERYPAMFAKLCEAVTSTSRQASKLLVTGRLEELGRVMTYNHAVLGMVGASNEQLDRLVDLCIASGCLGAKLTGAGGGGSVVAIAPRDEETEVADRIASKGFTTFISDVPTEGVSVWTSDR
jgi:mevalonate kinase